MLDELPLLKLGSKKVKMKLPDMWTKQAPVQRFEEKSAPSEKAEKTPQAIPTTPVATADAAAPPPDAAIAKEVDQKLTDAGRAEGGGESGRPKARRTASSKARRRIRSKRAPRIYTARSSSAGFKCAFVHRRT